MKKLLGKIKGFGAINIGYAVVAVGCLVLAVFCFVMAFMGCTPQEKRVEVLPGFEGKVIKSIVVEDDGRVVRIRFLSVSKPELLKMAEDTIRLNMNGRDTLVLRSVKYNMWLNGRRLP